MVDEKERRKNKNRRDWENFLEVYERHKEDYVAMGEVETKKKNNSSDDK